MQHAWKPYAILEYEEDVIRSNQERLSDLQEIESERDERRRIADEAERRAKEAQIRESQRKAAEKARQKQARVRQRNMEEERKNNLIRKMVDDVDGLNDSNQAQFYLEAAGWDLEQAVALWWADNDPMAQTQFRKQISSRASEKVTVYLILPNQDVIHETYDAGQLVFSIFPSIYSRIDQNKEVKITSSDGQVMDIELLTSTTFRDGGFVPGATFYVEELS